ncbi:phage tail protein [Pantoea rwandensis]|uniref:Phage tail protein n=1 Tax=Pantoea rwandensis TaxID=1076550 RepID=A0A1X1CNZ0_9GAMM|nr:phage tail protein [Pantoea rwandensis]ORM66128.1 phage tail protein [Pantoea rwandensis]
MAIEVFTWCPRINAEADIKFNTRKVQFGDGYTQVAGNGLNTRSQEWSLSFTGTEAYIKAIKDFLDAHEGTKAFQWQPPLEDIGLFRCDTYKTTPLGNKKYNLDATFEQAFKP